MASPVQTDGLSKWQLNLASYLKVISPISGLFTGNVVQMDPNSLSVKVPDIKVDDYIVDTSIHRIGPDHYSGSEFTSEWKNGIPPIVWTEYTMSRRRAFGYTVFDEQLKKSPIKNLVQEYVGRKMQTTVLRDHDKYILWAAINGRQRGKAVAKTTGAAHADAAYTAHTGDSRDYTWIAEPGENGDNELTPQFASVTGMFLDASDPFVTVDALTLRFSDNLFDVNLSNSDRMLLITPALQLAFLDSMLSKGSGTETAFNMWKGFDISGQKVAGELGVLKGGWRVVVMHPEFFPVVYTVGAANLANDPLTIDPLGTSATKAARKVIALACYKNAIQTYELFSNQLSSDGGTRFKGKEYVQEFAYDVWVIDQYAEAIVPLFAPGAVMSGDSISGYSSGVYLDAVNSFNNVANLVYAARQWEAGDPWVTYPATGDYVGTSRPGWFTSPYADTQPQHVVSNDYDGGPDEYGDLSFVRSSPGDVPQTSTALQETISTQAAQIDLLTTIALNGTPARANTAAVTLGQVARFASPVSLWSVETAGTTAAAQPSITGKDVGDTVDDGTAKWIRLV